MFLNFVVMFFVMFIDVVVFEYEFGVIVICVVIVVDLLIIVGIYVYYVCIGIVSFEIDVFDLVEMMCCFYVL